MTKITVELEPQLVGLFRAFLQERMKAIESEETALAKQLSHLEKVSPLATSAVAPEKPAEEVRASDGRLLKGQADEAILKYLNASIGHQKTSRQISDGTAINHTTIFRRLRKLSEQGLVTKDGNKWKVPGLL